MSISFNCKVKVKHNYKNINTIIQRLPQTTNEFIEDILKNIRGYAIRLEHGKNEQGILCEMIDMSTKEIKGKVYAKPEEFMTENNESYLWFEYFGTGNFAEMPHVENPTKYFVESGFTEWLIPKNKVKRKLNYPIITIRGNQFYLARGSKSNHFMENAEFKSRNENIEIAKNKIDAMLKEICK